MTAEKEATTETTAISNKDLERLGELASIVAATQDALTDDMVSRLASAFSEGMILLDRVTRNEGLVRFLQVLDSPENQALLVGLSDALTKTSREIASTPPAKGGIGCTYKVLTSEGTLEGLRLISLLGTHLSESLRDLHRHGGN